MNSIQSVRDSVKRSVAHSLTVVAHVRNLRGRTRAVAQAYKRIVGAETRAMLLALVYLRGRPYRSAEKHTRTPVPFVAIARVAGVEEPVVRAWAGALSAERKAA